MNEKDRIQAVADVVESWGFPVLERDERSVLFRYQLNYIEVVASQGDDNFLSVNLNNFYEIETDKEKSLLDRVCNDLNYKLMQVKAYHNDKFETTLSFEFFFESPTCIDFMLRKGLEGVVQAKRDFFRCVGVAMAEAED